MEMYNIHVETRVGVGNGSIYVGTHVGVGKAHSFKVACDSSACQIKSEHA